MRKRRWTKIWIGIYAMLAVLYYIAAGVSEHYGYRGYEVLYWAKYVLLIIPLGYIWCVGFSNLRRYKVRYPDRSVAGGRALLIMYSLILLPAMGFLAYKCHILQPPQWIIHPAAVVRREETQKELPKETEPPVPKTDSEDIYGTYEERPYGKVEDAYHKLYEEVLSMSYPFSEDNYNAKGNFYALLDEGETEYKGQQASYRITMVYDRISDDGLSYMFVNYKEYTTKEGTFTDFGLEYYVNMETGEIKAAEVPWGN